MRRGLMAVLVCGVLIASPAVMPAPSSAQVSTPAAPDRAAIEALVRRFFAIASQGDLETLDEVVSPDFVILTAPPGEEGTLEGLKATFAAARTGLPDFAIRVDDLIVEGDLVVVRTTIGGTHLGDFFGTPATGKRIQTSAIDLWQVEDGKLVANWHLEDILSVMEQLGTIPAAASTTPATAPATPPSPSTIPGDAATLAANVELARRFHDEIFEQGRLEVADEILAPGFVWHSDLAPGVEGVKTHATAVRTAFPDLTLTAEEIVAEGDRVAIRWTLSGTHQGEFLGAPATGNRVVTPGIDIYRIEDGRIAEIWTVGDELGLLMQLGAIPAFGGEAATPAAE